MQFAVYNFYKFTRFTSKAKGSMSLRAGAQRREQLEQVLEADAQALVERARVERRTGEEGDDAPPKTRFLKGWHGRARWFLRHAARPEIENDLRTRFERAANVNMRNQGMLAEFEGPHRPSRKSRCQPHRGRPETLLQATIVHILRRTAI